MKVSMFIGWCLYFTCLQVQAQATIFWEVSHPEHAHKSYLLGTYHLVGNWFADSLTVVKDKLFQSELAIFEAIADDSAVRQLILQRDDSFEYHKVLKKKQIIQLEAMAKDWKYPLSKLKPMEVLMKLQQDYYRTHCGNGKPGDSWSHFDDYLIHLAQERDIAVEGLETNEKQIEMLNASVQSWKEVKKPLKQWLKDWDDPSVEASKCAFSRTYRKMNLHYQLELPCPEDPLIQERNALWMPQLLALLPSQSCFVAVGLYHLYWDCGLVAELARAGYILTPLYSLN